MLLQFGCVCCIIAIDILVARKRKMDVHPRDGNIQEVFSMKTNRLISLLLCLCMVATLFTGFAETASADDYITYTVQNGDNLYTLVGKM